MVPDPNMICDSAAHLRFIARLFLLLHKYP
jgi:hypothetical protein